MAERKKGGERKALTIIISMKIPNESEEQVHAVYSYHTQSQSLLHKYPLISAVESFF